MPGRHHRPKVSIEMKAKIWYNRKWPFFRRCLHSWCWRYMAWNNRCFKHVRDR